MAIGRIPEPGTGIPESIIAAKGDILTGTANDTPAVLTAGTNETRLVADSAQATGLKYVADTTNYAVAAKGDLLVGTAADTLAPLTVGTDGHTLVADSTETTGLKWVAPSGGGGKVLQVVQDTHYQLTETTSTSYTDTGLSVSITPSSATSKVLVIATIQGVYRNAGNAQTRCQLKLLRASTDLVITEGNGATGTSQFADIGTVAMTYLDEPATTSATTYKIQFASSVSGQTAGINDYYLTNNTTSSIVVMEIGA